MNVAQDPDADLGELDNLNILRALHLDAVAVLVDLIADGELDEKGLEALDELDSCAELFGQDDDADSDADSDSDSDSDSD